MANLNETTERINSLLADVEEPIRAAIPQVTRTVKAADEMMQVVSGPAMAVAPGLHRLAETLSNPAFDQLPHQLGQFSELLGDVSKRLAPLTQLAESAGGLFGGFRVPGTRAPQPVARPTPEPSGRSIVATVHTASTPEPTRGMSPAAKPPATRRPAAKRTATQRSAAKKSSAKKSSARKSPAKKSPAKRSSAKRSSAKKRSAPER
jgi:hypothetical protein